MKLFPTTTDWLALDSDARRQIQPLFLMGRSGPKETMTIGGESKVTCDGVTNKDLESAMSIGQMIKYLGKDLPWYREDLCDYLFSLVLDKFYGRTTKKETSPVVEPIGIGGEFTREELGRETITEPEEGAQPRRRGRPKKTEGSISTISQPVS